MARPEETIERNFVSACASIGVQAYKFEISGTKGAPDRIIFLPKGKVLLIEFKQPGGKTSKHQDVFIAKLKELGHECIVAEDWEYPFNIVRTYVNE